MNDRLENEDEGDVRPSANVEEIIDLARAHHDQELADLLTAIRGNGHAKGSLDRLIHLTRDALEEGRGRA